MGNKPNPPVNPDPNNPNPLPNPNPPQPCAEPPYPADAGPVAQHVIRDLRQQLANANGLLAQSDDLERDYKQQLADKNTLIEQYLQQLAAKRG